MRLNEVDTGQPEIGDILEFNINGTIVETVIVGINKTTHIATYIVESPGNDMTLLEHIVKVKGGWELKSKKTGKNLGKYPTHAGAEKREREVQYFKHMGEETVIEKKEKIKVYTKNPKTGRVIKVDFGEPDQIIKKSKKHRKNGKKHWGYGK